MIFNIISKINICPCKFNIKLHAFFVKKKQRKITFKSKDFKLDLNNKDF